MIVTNGYITKLQKEKHCSILYANQGFFSQVVIWRIWRFFPKLFSKIIWIYTRKTNFSKNFWICLSKKLFKNTVQSLFKLHNVGPCILWIYRIILKMNHTPCQNERISVLNGINKQYSWKKKYNKDPQKDQAVKAGESNAAGPLGWCPLNSLWNLRCLKIRWLGKWGHFQLLSSFLAVFFLLANFCKNSTWKMRFQSIQKIFHGRIGPNSPNLKKKRIQIARFLQ
jgi:hypothetical protein